MNAVNIVIAPKGAGKSAFILNQLSDGDVLVVSQSTKPDEFVSRCTDSSEMLQRNKVIEESSLDKEVSEHNYSHVYFTDLFAFVENAERHLDLFCSVAQFAIAAQTHVWGEITVSPKEVEGCREAVQALVSVAPSTAVQEVRLRDGAGILLQIDPQALLTLASKPVQN